MATRFDRIPVTKDPALSEALDRSRPLIGIGKPAARLVHDLAAFRERMDRASRVSVSGGLLEGA